MILPMQYGLDPDILKAPSTLKPTEKSAPLTSVKDRTSNLQAMTLAFAAEKGLSFRDVPDLIAYAKVTSLYFIKYFI